MSAQRRQRDGEAVTPRGRDGEKGEGIVCLDRRRNRTKCGNQSVSIIRIFLYGWKQVPCCIYKWRGEGEERDACRETLSSSVTEPGVWLFQQPRSSQRKSTSAIFLQHLLLILSRILFLLTWYSATVFVLTPLRLAKRTSLLKQALIPCPSQRDIPPPVSSAWCAQYSKQTDDRYRLGGGGGGGGCEGGVGLKW